MERPADRALVQDDPLRRYFAEIARHPLLSPEEEHALAVKYRDEGDLDAAYKLVTANLRLVVKIAHEYHRAAFSLLDLVQEGNIGLMQAVKKFDPSRGVKLSSYAAWWIRAYIIRFIMDNWRMVKLGTTRAQRKLFFNLAREKQRLLAMGVEVEPKLLAEHLDVTEDEVREMEGRMSADDLRLDAPLQGAEDTNATNLDHLADKSAAVDDKLGEDQLAEIFKQKLAAFAENHVKGDKERYILEHRLMADEPKALQEIGDHFGISRERVRQIEVRLIAKMKEFMSGEIPDFKLLTLERNGE